MGWCCKQASSSGWGHSEASGIFFIVMKLSVMWRGWERSQGGGQMRENRVKANLRPGFITRASTSTEEQGVPRPHVLLLSGSCKSCLPAKSYSLLIRESSRWMITSLTPLVFTLIIFLLSAISMSVRNLHLLKRKKKKVQKLISQWSFELVFK